MGEHLNPEATLKLTEAVEELTEAVEELVQKPEKSPFDALTDCKKSFIEASKAFTLFAGAGLNAMNTFAVTLAYMSKHAMKVNTDAANTTPTAAPPTNSDSSPPNSIQSFLILGTMFCYLFTSCAAAIAHATVHRTEWYYMLVVIMALEVALVNASCALYSYLLTEGVCCILSVALSFVSWVLMSSFVDIGFYG